MRTVLSICSGAPARAKCVLQVFCSFRLANCRWYGSPIRLSHPLLEHCSNGQRLYWSTSRVSFGTGSRPPRRSTGRLAQHSDFHISLDSFCCFYNLDIPRLLRWRLASVTCLAATSDNPRHIPSRIPAVVLVVSLQLRFSFRLPPGPASPPSLSVNRPLPLLQLQHPCIHISYSCSCSCHLVSSSLFLARRRIHRSARQINPGLR